MSYRIHLAICHLESDSFIFWSKIYIMYIMLPTGVVYQLICMLFRVEWWKIVHNYFHFAPAICRDVSAKKITTLYIGWTFIHTPCTSFYQCFKCLTICLTKQKTSVVTSIVNVIRCESIKYTPTHFIAQTCITIRF